MVSFKIWPGSPHPLGATVQAGGVNFAVYSENATGVDLCIFEQANSPTETIRVRMVEKTNHAWHCFVPGAQAGQFYGYRAYGPYEPTRGHRFNPAKLLLDPYAKAITGLVNWSGEMLDYLPEGDDPGHFHRDERDNAWCMPKAVVIADDFDWGNDRSPRVPLAESVIYEVHVKGFSKLCPGIPQELRGTYAALGSDFALEYFRKLGVTAIELLPIHHFVNDGFLEDKGLSNYWGYNSIGFFAPHSTYALSGSTGEQVQEFKEMVKRLHAAGLEVILDVVYNHTGEGNHLGPTLSFRGLDNASYYRLVRDDRRYYMDYTGTGNTLNTQHPAVLQLLMDSLRYWVTEMHVDGFRFDLASSLAREFHDVSRISAFFNCIHQDPILAHVKMIAEPWDIGEGGYQVGNFPVRWAEWNGKYRDCVRAYWKGDMGQLSEVAYRLTASSDLFEDDGRRPYASINFLCAHDGFTLHDTVAFNEKHNEANGEENMDGHSDNRSWNCGAEGSTDDEAVNTLRRRQLRNFLATLLFSQGVPMLLGGDEFARTQRGNNNAYCQDNEISWFHWEHQPWQTELRDFTAKLIAMRKEHPVLRRPKWLHGRRIAGTGVKDLMWFDTDGSEMTQQDWSGEKRCLGMLLSGDALDVNTETGEPVRDETLLLLFNAHHEAVKFALPGKENVGWEVCLNTRHESGVSPDETVHVAGDEMELIERSMCVLRLVKGSEEEARSISWKQQQQAEAVAPPVPPKPSRHEAIDPTSASARFRARNKPQPKLSDLSQGAVEPSEPPIKT